MKLRVTIDVDDHDLQTLLAQVPRLLAVNRDPSTETGEIPALLTVAEAAEALRVSRGQVYEMTRTGQIRSIKIGRKLMVPRNAIGWFIDEQLDSATKPTASMLEASARDVGVRSSTTSTQMPASSRRRSDAKRATKPAEPGTPRRRRQRVSTDPVTVAEFADTFEVPVEEAERIFHAGKFETEDSDGTLLAQRRHVLEWMKTDEFDAWGEEWIGKAPRRPQP